MKIVSVTGDLPLKTTRDAKYGNTIYHAVAPKAAKDEYTFDVQYDVVRHERIGLPRAGQQPQLVKASAKEANEYLAPDKLVPTTGKLADIAAQQVQGHTGTMDRARALYDYVFATMKYDKTGTGWGRGDAEWACDSKRGNCTDFHSVFISMARSQGIPARFEIGFPLPANKNSGDIAGYHCWAEFYDSQYGWVPVDISEAWKDQSQEGLFLRRPRRESRAIFHGPRSGPESAAGRRSAQLLRLSLRGSGRQKVGERLQPLLVRRHRNQQHRGHW